MIRLAFRCRVEQADLVLAELLALVPDGVEEERGRELVEFAIYGAPGELPALPDLRAAAGDGLVEVETTEVPDDWADRWRDFHDPVLVGGRLLVRPSWRDDAGPADVEVVVDPGQAFGTGAHATTRLCLELLLELAERGEAGGPLVDLGTGSGVLAIAAAKLGWGPVTGVDHEPAALEAAAENARLNEVSLELRRENLREEAPPRAPTALANLTAPLLRQVLGGLAGAPPRTLVCSGLLEGERGTVETAIEAAGLEPVTHRDAGGWSAILARG